MNNVRDEPALSARAPFRIAGLPGTEGWSSVPLPLCAFLLGLCGRGRRTARLTARQLAGLKAC